MRPTDTSWTRLKIRDRKMTSQIAALRKRRDRTGREKPSCPDRLFASGPVVFPAPLFGPSFATPVFSVALSSVSVCLLTVAVESETVPLVAVGTMLRAMCDINTSDLSGLCVGGRHNMPPPLQVDLQAIDLERGVRVMCNVGFLCANFSLEVEAEAFHRMLLTFC